MTELFKFDLISSNMLFDDEGFMRDPNKSTLVTELEKNLTPEDYIPQHKWAKISTFVIVDVMAYARKVRVKSLKTFGDFSHEFFRMIFSLCHDASRIDFVFDSYLTGSVKDSERQRRAKTRPIEISSISNDTPLPVQMDTFWASGTNKAKLQSFLAASAQNKIGNTELILSGWSSDEGATLPQVIQSSQNIDPDKLVFDIEEADLRIIPHAIDCANNGSKRLVILSNYTDVTIVTLYYWSILQSIGHQECWVKFGVSNTTRYIPLHTLAERIGSLTKFLPSIHALTGNDITSKFGTKFSALKISPEKYLTYFGKKTDGLDINMVLADAEQFLVQVLKPGSKCKSLDELRHYMYHYNKSTTIDKLPPTSYAARSHLLRAF